VQGAAPGFANRQHKNLLGEVALRKVLVGLLLVGGLGLTAARKPVSAQSNSPKGEQTALAAARLTAAMDELTHEYPLASEKRDQLLLWTFLREARSTAEVEPFFELLKDRKAKFLVFRGSPPVYSRLFYYYQKMKGDTADDIGHRLDRLQPLYSELRSLAAPLPERIQRVYRWGPTSWKKSMNTVFSEQGSLDAEALFALRGVCKPGLDHELEQAQKHPTPWATVRPLRAGQPSWKLERYDYLLETLSDQSAIYVAEKAGSSSGFGAACQTLQLRSKALYLAKHDPDVNVRLLKLFERYGLTDRDSPFAGRAQWDFFQKAGIDIADDDGQTTETVLKKVLVLERESSCTHEQACRRVAKQIGEVTNGWLRIYNPQIIVRID
jgi:hypothetical protein